MSETAIYVISRNAYNAALADDATSNTFPAPTQINEGTVVYDVTRLQIAEMASHMFYVRDALKAAGDEYSRRQARSLDRAATKIVRMLAARLAETDTTDTDENNAMRAPRYDVVRDAEGRLISRKLVN